MEVDFPVNAFCKKFGGKGKGDNKGKGKGKAKGQRQRQEQPRQALFGSKFRISLSLSAHAFRDAFLTFLGVLELRWIRTSAKGLPDGLEFRLVEQSFRRTVAVGFCNSNAFSFPAYFRAERGNNDSNFEDFSDRLPEASDT